MNIADQLAKEHIILQMNNRLLGSVRNWLVNEFQHQSCRKQHAYQHHGHATKTPCQGESEGAFLNASGTKVKNQAVEKVSITITIRWSLQRAGKNGIAYTLEQVEPIWHDIVFLHIRRFLKIRRFIKCNSNSYPADTCLSMQVPKMDSGIIDFITTS